MKTVLVTGSRGYIAGALVARLTTERHELKLVSRMPEIAQTEEQFENTSRIIRGDLRDDAVWTELLKGTTAIVHLSSRTDLRSAERDPTGDEELNVAPVRALVRAAEKAANPVKVIFASTVTIVGVEHTNPVNERTPDRPCSVYERHKGTSKNSMPLGPVRVCCPDGMILGD